MAKKSKAPVFKITNKVPVIKSKISIVRGVSVSKLRSILTDAGFKDEDIRIQGVDIDSLDRNEIKRILGDDLKELRDLPIIVSGIGTKSLFTLLKHLDRVRVIPGGIGNLAGKTLTMPTMTITGTMDRKTMTMDPITFTGRTRNVIDSRRKRLIIEGLTRDELERVLTTAGFNLDKIRVRPFGDRSDA